MDTNAADVEDTETTKVPSSASHSQLSQLSSIQPSNNSNRQSQTLQQVKPNEDEDLNENILIKENLGLQVELNQWAIKKEKRVQKLLTWIE